MPTDSYAVKSEQARRMGEERGREIAGWFFDGNTSDETYASVLQGISDGDPEILDSFPCSPLSGEWAGDPLPADILEALGVDAGDDAADEYLSAYEQGFEQASADEIERTCLAHLPWDVVNPA